MKSIIILIDYFGKWPEWMPVFLASCEANPTVNWLFHTDCPIPEKHPSNVSFVSISFLDYCQHVSDVLKISFKPQDSYKICDIKPARGVLYADEIKNYDYYGYGDLDVIYGNIRKFFIDDVLVVNYISTGNDVATGHFSLFKNKDWIRKSFYRCHDWKEKMENPVYLGLDEIELRQVFSIPEFIMKCKKMFKFKFFYIPIVKLLELVYLKRIKYWKNNYCVEQYTTPFINMPWIDGTMNHPDVWYWEKGKLTNNLDGNREFLYLHFMNFKSSKYIYHEAFGLDAPWEKLSKLLNFDLKDINIGCVRIDKQGFHLEPSKMINKKISR